MVDLSRGLSKNFVRYLLDSFPSFPTRLYNPTGHGVGINDGNAEVSEHVGHRTFAGGNPALKTVGKLKNKLVNL